MEALLSPVYYAGQLLMSILNLFGLLLAYPLSLLWYIFGPIINYLGFLISGPLKLLLGTMQFGSILTAILVVPISNYLVYKSKKISQNHKFAYVSLVTILIGFIMLVTELGRIRDPIGLDDRISRKYRPKTDISTLRLFQPGFESFQEWQFCVSSDQQLVNLQRLL